MTSGVKSPRNVNNDPGPMVDFSFANLTSLLEIDGEVPRNKTSCKTLNGKFRSTSLKFNNNKLADLEGLEKAVDLLESPSDLEFLDLSFNEILKLDNDILQYPKLKILYLHGNMISKLEEINKLAALPNLYNLAIHGNPIENEPEFRPYILSHLPHLKKLNSAPITKADHKDAERWKTICGSKKKRRRRKDTD
ncbi:leucine-rich repeat-containing protein 51-like [Lytechinus pictus]|uniref:leucine-rich repeat-containing protein 51-like n=1 Tax=Lytechinus pictus TaxID=7653 RepID=UPI00240D8688|nr:leucine-rich repeat-containing protein 51-like [Lytechinus pictus]